MNFRGHTWLGGSTPLGGRCGVAIFFPATISRIISFFRAYVWCSQGRLTVQRTRTIPVVSPSPANFGRKAAACGFRVTIFCAASAIFWRVGGRSFWFSALCLLRGTCVGHARYARRTRGLPAAYHRFSCGIHVFALVAYWGGGRFRGRGPAESVILRVFWFSCAGFPRLGCVFPAF